MTSYSPATCRNIAIIAHVDHGKTTLVDRLLQQSGTLGERFGPVERVMDANDLEKERGITITSKHTAIDWKGFRINIVDTPGHADFGGEVERILAMVDSVLLLVDAVDGPMPQTRFVTQKAFEHKLKPIVVINKIDRDGARPDWVLEQTFDLFDNLGATDEQLDFPCIYASATKGIATTSLDRQTTNLDALFSAIIENVPPPPVELEGAFQMQISTLDYSTYVGAIGIGRINRGQLESNQMVVIIDPQGITRRGRVLQLFTYHGLQSVEITKANAGDIIAINGIEDIGISDTLCDPAHPEALPALTVNEPTISMVFQVNTSPFAGQEGKYLTSRQIIKRLQKELIHNVALRVSGTDNSDRFKVSGRGELHLAILLENMRRESYEIAVSRPQVIYQTIDGILSEPFEELSIDIEAQHQGAVMEAIGERRGQLVDMNPDSNGRLRLQYRIPTQSLIGFQSEFMTMTSGSGLIFHVFDRYAPIIPTVQQKHRNGAMISSAKGKALAFALFNLQRRGSLFIQPGDQIYEGQVIGIHSRSNDLVVNPLKGKQLTNMRASGKDESIVLEPAIKLTLESAIEIIADDELVEITPKHIRIRKKLLHEHERKRDSRSSVGFVV